jgi:hypothetical protein
LLFFPPNGNAYNIDKQVEELVRKTVRVQAEFFCGVKDEIYNPLRKEYNNIF